MTDIAVVVKSFLISYYRDEKIDKDDYKYILKKAVKKIYAAEKPPDENAPLAISREKVKSLVKSYVEKLA